MNKVFIKKCKIVMMFALIISLLVIPCDTISARNIVKCKKLNLEIKEITLGIGDIATLKPTIYPINTTERIKWSSTNDNIASVNQNGVVTALSEGECEIYVKTFAGKKSCCKVNVKKYLTEDEVNEIIKNNVLSEESIKKLISDNTLSQEQIIDLVKSSSLSEEDVKELIKNNTISEESVREMINENVISQEEIYAYIDDNCVKEEDLEGIVGNSGLSEEDVIEIIEKYLNNTNDENLTKGELTPFRGVEFPLTRSVNFSDNESIYFNIDNVDYLFEKTDSANANYKYDLTIQGHIDYEIYKNNIDKLKNSFAILIKSFNDKSYEMQGFLLSESINNDYKKFEISENGDFVIKYTYYSLFKYDEYSL